MLFAPSNKPKTLCFFLTLFLIQFSFESLHAQGPANNNYANATELTLDTNGQFCSSGSPYSNADATSDHTQPSNWQEGPNKNVWFKFEAHSSGIANIKVNGNSMERPMIAVYDSLLNEVGSQGYPTNYWQNTGLLIDSLSAGATYYIAVDSYIGGSYQGGTFDICILSEVDNDYIEGAVELTLDSAGVFCSTGAPYSNADATSDHTKPSNWQEGPYHNVWFKFTADSSGIANIKVNGNSMERPMVAVYDSLLNEVGSQGYPTNYWENTGLLLDSLSAGVTYYLVVDSYVGGNYQGGTFDICILSEVDNDYIGGAVELTLDSAGVFCSTGAPYSNADATSDHTKPSNWQEGPHHNVWFKFTADSSGIANIKVNGNSMERPMVAVYDSLLNEVGSQGYPTNYWENTGLLLDSLSAGVTYYLVVDSYVGGNYQGGTFDICILSEVDNDYIEGAIELTLDSTGVFCSTGEPYSTSNATSDHTQPANWPSGPHHNVWFKFTADSSGIVNIKVNGGNMKRPMVAVYDSLLNEVGSQGYPTNYWQNTGLLLDSLSPGATYYIAVDSYVAGNPQGGTFNICVLSKVDDDYKAGATELVLDTNGQYCSGTPFSTINYTSDQTKPDSWQEGPNHNIWLKVWIPYDGDISFDLNRVTIDYMMYGLYDSENNLVASSGYAGEKDDREFDVNDITGNQFYYLTVDSRVYSNDQGGTFDVCIDYEPQLVCTTELWAIGSGAWDNPAIWSDSQGGQPISAIPCEQTLVHISGYEVTFNSSTPVTFKRLEIEGVSTSSPSVLDIQTGQLNVREKVKVSGPGASMHKSANSYFKVTGPGGG